MSLARQYMRPTFVVGGDEAEDVLVPQHDSLVDLRLPEPRTLLTSVEDLDSHILTPPPPSPHLPITPFADDLVQLDLPGNGPLHQQG